MSLEHVHLRGDKRSAFVYLCAGTESTYRIRAEKSYPDAEPASGWYGGKVLWGHDQDTMDKALLIAELWVDEGILPADG